MGGKIQKALLINPFKIKLPIKTDLTAYYSPIFSSRCQQILLYEIIKHHTQ
jgi:hypothetical protein